MCHIVSTTEHFIQVYREFNDEYFHRKIKSEQWKITEILIKYGETYLLWKTGYMENNKQIVTYRQIDEPYFL
jgi:hypothetical protein